MAVFGASGEQEPRSLVVDVDAVVEDQLELVSASEFAIDREIHTMEPCSHCAFQLAGKRSHRIHVIVVLLSIRYVPLGHHERTILPPIVPNVSHNLSNDPHMSYMHRRKSITA